MFSDKVQVAPANEFELTFLPVLKWMKLIGALAPFSRLNCVYLFGFAYRFFAWCFTLFVHGFSLFNAFYWFFNSTNNKVTLWVEIVNYVAKSAHAVGIHTVMFFLLVGRWDQLKYSLNRTENRLGLKRIDYYNFWHWSLAGVFYIIASEGCLTVFKLYVAKDVPIHNSFGKQFLEIATMATKIYATSSVILFCLASLAIANQFDNIRYQVEENMHLFNNTAEILMRLQSQYSSVCHSVENLNYCFGLTLLIEISFNFLSIISSTMEFLFNKGQVSWQMCFQLIIFMNNLINLLAICFSVENLRTKNKNLGLTLYQFVDNRPEFEKEIQGFATHMLQTTPQVNAWEFFEIGKSLIPELIGTTFTYILIMVQFYAAEKQ